MPSFDCGGDACGRYSCHSCTSESVRGEYWRLLGVLRDADKARIATDAWLRKEHSVRVYGQNGLQDRTPSVRRCP